MEDIILSFGDTIDILNTQSTPEKVASYIVIDPDVENTEAMKTFCSLVNLSTGKIVFSVTPENVYMDLHTTDNAILDFIYYGLKETEFRKSCRVRVTHASRS